MYYNVYMAVGSDVKLTFGIFLIKVTLTRVMRSMCGILVRETIYKMDGGVQQRMNACIRV